LAKSLISTKYQIWLILSILVAILFSASGLKLAFQSSYTIQDDARQYLFWMQQFQNPQLFQADLIANYFQTVTPFGYSSLYKVVSYLGINIFFFNKISTLLLGIVTTIYTFLVCVEIFPVPLAGFLSSLLLNQNLWMVDDLSSGTPRAFIYVLLLAFIYYLLKNKILFCLLTILLQGLFYPQAVLISALILLIRIVNSQFLKTNKAKIIPRIELYGLLTAFIILAIYAAKTSTFAPVITADQAKLLPEFSASGRSAFFSDNFVQFWLSDRRSGFFPIEWQYSLICSYGLGLFWLVKYPQTFPLVKQIKPKLKVLVGRYTHHSLRIILALLDGMTIAILFNFITTKISQKIEDRHTFEFKNIKVKTICLFFLLIGLLAPFHAVQSYPQRLGYVTGSASGLYQFLGQQPQASLVATLSKEADFIPSLTGRSVLVAEEYAIPYHQGYYQSIRQRVKDLISAQYSTKKETLIDFINHYQPDFWLLDKSTFTSDYLAKNEWLQQFQPETSQALKKLKNKEEIDQYTLVDTNCLVHSPNIN